jgi:hypothetical protein
MLTYKLKPVLAVLALAAASYIRSAAGAGESQPSPLVLAIDAIPPVKAPERSAIYPDKRTACIPLTAKAPVCDGTIDAQEWSGAALFCGFNAKREFAKSETVARVCRDANNLYIAFHCALPPKNGALSVATKRDFDVWQDESVEVFIDPGQKKKAYFQFILNTLNTQQDSQVFQSVWNATWESKTRVEKDFWEAELAIPFSALGGAPKSGDAWGFNLNHTDKRNNEHSSWSHLLIGAHDPDRWGVITFGELPALDLFASSSGRLKPGASEWRVCCVNRGAQAVKGRLALAGDAPTIRATAVDVELPPGVSTHRIPCEYTAIGKGSARISWQSAGATPVEGETVAWRLIEPCPLRLRAAENESYIGEQTLGLWVVSELEDLAQLPVELTLRATDSADVLRVSKLAKLPGGESRCRLSVAGLKPGTYEIHARIIGPDAQPVGEHKIQFVRCSGPFE